MNLDENFILYSCFLLLLLVPLYIYKGKIPFLAKNEELGIFLKDVALYLSNNHPYISFEYNMIIEKTKQQEDIKVREGIIVDNLVIQFVKYNYILTTQDSVPLAKLWSTYNENSKSNSKYPIDWQKRKELAWNRDDKKCNRCGRHLSITDTNTSFVNDISDGGGYNMENIIILCSDCKKILKETNVKTSSLQINENLLKYVQS